MKLELVMVTARWAVIEIKDGGYYHTKESFEVLLNGSPVKETDQVITPLHNLTPQTVYTVCVRSESGCEAALSFQTEEEFVTLNVKEMGAKGDGSFDDTLFIQAAIMACPKKGRVLIPKGEYRITSLFLKSHITLELEKGAVLGAETDRIRFPKLSGMVESWDEESEYNLGTWEGNPLPMFSGILTGIEVENVVICGEGVIDGRAGKDNWWLEEKKMKGAFRPRLLFLERCRGVTVEGLTFINSPSWTIHPYFSNELSFLCIQVENPFDSPNTDGLDPESCRDVRVLGAKFSLGDDCIAIKSGKIYMGRRYKTPSENIHVRQCLMENGHGAVTVGSEVGAGVRHMRVEECLFRHTDRGLRIKTRRGRGKDSVLEDICFDHIFMDHVMTPFVVNSFYFCDPDGKTEYVQCRSSLPVDDRTPWIRDLYFRHIRAVNCHVAAAFLFGLPERKIQSVEFEDVSISFASQSRAGVPAMLCGVGQCEKTGIRVVNAGRLVLRNVTVTGQDGEALILEGVDDIIGENCSPVVNQERNQYRNLDLNRNRNESGKENEKCR